MPMNFRLSRVSLVALALLIAGGVAFIAVPRGQWSLPDGFLLESETDCEGILRPCLGGLGAGCDDPLSLCLGDRPHEAEALWGRETSRERQNHTWELEDGTVDIWWRDPEHGIEYVNAVIPLGEATNLRFSLPGGLTLGASTMGDVIASLGPPDDKGRWAVKGGRGVAYHMHYYGIPSPRSDPTIGITFTRVVETEDDPHGWTEAINSLKVTGFNVMFIYGDVAF